MMVILIIIVGLGTEFQHTQSIKIDQDIAQHLTIILAFCKVQYFALLVLHGSGTIQLYADGGVLYTSAKWLI